jgi:hypothetical protein
MTDAWVPDACTLPTVDRPVRVAEFDELFGAALRSTRTTRTSLRIEFGPTVAEWVRDLTDRESQCCAFFDFTIHTEPDRVILDIAVPETQRAILDAIEARSGLEP